MSQPEMVEMDALHFHTVVTEWMEVAVADPCPVVEFDAELETGLRGANELDLVDAECAIESYDGRNGGLTHANGADLIGLHHIDRVAAPCE